MKCWHCGEQLEDPLWGKVSFRAVCEKCQAALHCCCNCLYHKPGASNECLIPGTSWISDREKSNFCEDFKLKGTGLVAIKTPEDVSKRLFGEEDLKEKMDPKKRFQSLFDDEIV